MYIMIVYIRATLPVVVVPRSVLQFLHFTFNNIHDDTLCYSIRLVYILCCRPFLSTYATAVLCSLAAKLKNTPSVLTKPPVFADKHEERIFLKERLALAFRIFGYLGYDGTPRIWSTRW